MSYVARASPVQIFRENAPDDDRLCLYDFKLSTLVTCWTIAIGPSASVFTSVAQSNHAALDFFRPVLPEANMIPLYSNRPRSARLSGLPPPRKDFDFPQGADICGRLTSGFPASSCPSACGRNRPIVSLPAISTVVQNPPEVGLKCVSAMPPGARLLIPARYCLALSLRRNVAVYAISRLVPHRLS